MKVPEQSNEDRTVLIRSSVIDELLLLVDARNHGVVTLIGLCRKLLVFFFLSSAIRDAVQRTKSQLLLGEELVLTKLLDFGSEDLLRGSSGVNARSLDGDEETTTLLQEQLGVDTDNSMLR